MKDTVTVVEAAVLLGVRTDEVYKLIYSRKLEAIKCGKMWRVSLLAVKERNSLKEQRRKNA